MKANSIKIPDNPTLQVCYDTIEEETPELWAEFCGQLLTIADSEEPADDRARKVLLLEKDIWQRFLTEDTDRKARVVKGSWDCCIADLSAALIRVAMQDVTASSVAAEHKRARLEALRTFVREDLAGSASGMSMNLDLQMAINELS